MTELTEEAKAARREYYRQYRAKNRDRINERNRERWNRVAEKNKAIQPKRPAASEWTRPSDALPELRHKHDLGDDVNCWYSDLLVIIVKGEDGKLYTGGGTYKQYIFNDGEKCTEWRCLFPPECDADSVETSDVLLWREAVQISEE